MKESYVEDIDLDSLHFDSIKLDVISKSGVTQALTDLKLETSEATKLITCKLDTGAEGDVIGVEKFKILFPQHHIDDSGKPQDLQP